MVRPSYDTSALLPTPFYQQLFCGVTPQLRLVEKPKQALGYPLENEALYLLGTSLPPSPFTEHRSITAWTLACAMEDGTTVVRIHEAQEYRNTRGQYWRRSYTPLHDVPSHPRINTIVKIAGASIVGWDAYHDMVNSALKDWNNCQGKTFQFDDPWGTRGDVITLLRMLENEDRELMYSADELAEILLQYEVLASSGPERCYGSFAFFTNSGSDKDTASSDSRSMPSTSSPRQPDYLEVRPTSIYYTVPYRHTLYLVAHDWPSHAETSMGISWAVAYPDNDGRLRCIQQFSHPICGSTHAWSSYVLKSQTRRVFRLSEPGRFSRLALVKLLRDEFGELLSLSDHTLETDNACLLASNCREVTRVVQQLGGVTWLPNVFALEEELEAIEAEMMTEILEEAELALWEPHRHGSVRHCYSSLEIVFRLS